jgi:hypothetical protein
MRWNIILDALSHPKGRFGAYGMMVRRAASIFPGTPPPRKNAKAIIHTLFQAL